MYLLRLSCLKDKTRVPKFRVEIADSVADLVGPTTPHEIVYAGLRSQYSQLSCRELKIDIERRINSIYTSGNSIAGSLATLPLDESIGRMNMADTDRIMCAGMNPIKERLGVGVFILGRSTASGLDIATIATLMDFLCAVATTLNQFNHLITDRRHRFLANCDVLCQILAGILQNRSRRIYHDSFVMSREEFDWARINCAVITGRKSIASSIQSVASEGINIDLESGHAGRDLIMGKRDADVLYELYPEYFEAAPQEIDSWR